MRRCAIAVAVLAGLLLGLGSAALAQAERKGRMPLDASERALAREGARIAVDKRLGKPLGDGRREILSVERRRDAEKQQAGRARPARTRSAEVLVYDYDENVTRRIGVRLPGGEVESFETLPGVQPPLAPAEVQRALAIAYADPRVRGRIQDLYRARTGTPLADPGELHSKAMVFDARSNPIGLSAAAARCGEHRCAQLLLFTADLFAIEATPIVDLSSGAVVQVGDF
jgi:hypothetical protein